MPMNTGAFSYRRILSRQQEMRRRGFRLALLPDRRDWEGFASAAALCRRLWCTKRLDGRQAFERFANSYSPRVTRDPWLEVFSTGSASR